ncbi:sigma-70 family RNA polymerase sigma factor [Dactylosporangium sp. NPDC050688]|uniref:sigma-70 family RNA polymerase sigma factor n=1 Tax=Dactylosporangium sp. NPDC050688 TaxID=3157217 RepID=UPI0033F66878
MNHDEWLAEHFESHRPQLLSAARRLLGSGSDADDAIQDAWIRISRADTSGVENPAGWMTTVVARVCFDMLRARRSWQYAPSGDPEPVADPTEADPEQRAVEADLVGVALLVVLETLTPPERLAFVLHDVFGLPFNEVAPIVGRSPAATRQLASRARRRVRGAEHEAPADPLRRATVVQAFLAASRAGDFQALLDLLDPMAEARSDAAAVSMGSLDRVHGADAVAEFFSGRAKAAKAALIDGHAGAVWSHGDTLKVAFLFTVADDRIVAIDLVADPGRLSAFDVELVDA